MELALHTHNDDKACIMTPVSTNYLYLMEKSSQAGEAQFSRVSHKAARSRLNLLSLIALRKHFCHLFEFLQPSWALSCHCGKTRDLMCMLCFVPFFSFFFSGLIIICTLMLLMLMKVEEVTTGTSWLTRWSVFCSDRPDSLRLTLYFSLSLSLSSLPAGATREKEKKSDVNSLRK